MRPLRPAAHPSRDPAPSRAAYRMQRLWLTPGIRLFTRLGLPVLGVALLATWYASDEERLAGLGRTYEGLRAAIAQRPEFMVTSIEFPGASPGVAQDIRTAFPMEFPVSSFDLDLEAMRLMISDLDAVADVSIQIRSGGVLEMLVTERVPAIVWKNRDTTDLLDAEGNRVASAQTRAAPAELPLIAGRGADGATAEALRIYAVARPLGERILGLVRMGERRWDVVLKSGQRILLPESQPEAALERVIALHQASDLLGRDVVSVDMRNPARPTVRMSETAVEEMRRKNEIAVKGIRG